MTLNLLKKEPKEKHQKKAKNLPNEGFVY